MVCSNSQSNVLPLRHCPAMNTLPGWRTVPRTVMSSTASVGSTGAPKHVPITTRPPSAVIPKCSRIATVFFMRQPDETT